MSLEQALADNTAVMKQLIAVLSTAVEAGGVAAPAGPASEAPKRTRRTKAEIEAEAAAAAAPAATPAPTAEPAAADPTAAPGYLLAGDPEGTRYFHIAKHNSVYKQKPGDPNCTIEGALIVSGAEYQKWAEEYAKNAQSVAASAATQVAPSPTAHTASATPPAASPVAGAVTIQTVTEKLMQLHKRDGNPGVKAILDKFGVASVPALATKNLVEVDAHVESVLNPAASNNLFG